MGALHEGHRSLMAFARRSSDVLVASLFVNPLQFGPEEDLHRYPRTVQMDKTLCERVGVDILFIPNEPTIYPERFQTVVSVRKVARGYEGQSRPTHFEGVATILNKLCHIVDPDTLIVGQKDYQQAMVIRQMFVDLNMRTKLVARPTVRESDGLALSSRNALLHPDERRAATALYRGLREGARCVRHRERSPVKIRLAMRVMLEQEPLVMVDYVGIAHPETLAEMKLLSGQVVLLIAAYVGTTRLIDNLIVRVPR